MGDEQTQTQQDPLWWALDPSPDEGVSSPHFGDPVEWPDATAWEVLFEDGPPTRPAPYVPDDLGVELLFPPADDAVVGSAPRWDAGPDEPTELRLEALPDSIWAGGDLGGGDGTGSATVATPVATLGGAVSAVDLPAGAPTTAGPAPAAKRQSLSWPGRFKVRHGPAAMVALASVVSLVILGMFLSVRARNDLPTETFGPTDGQVATQGSSSSVPPPTTVATSAPPSTISLAELVPADDAAAAGVGAAGAGTGTAATAPRSTTATTAAPSRATATTAPAAASQPTNTTAAPQPETTSPSTTSPPPEDTATTQVTRPPRSIPSIPDITYTIPSIPSMPGGRFSNN